MPTASGRTMTCCGPGGPGSGTSPTTITPGDLVTAASIWAGHPPPAGAAKSAGQERYTRPMRRIAPSGRPGNEVSPQTGQRLPGSGHKTRQARPGEGHKHDKKLDKIFSARIP